MASVQAVISALDVFTRAPDKAALDQASNWLQDFQHSRDAWATCNVLLLTPDAPAAAKLFAAQTFRTKVTYDLHEMNVADIIRVRDTLLTALQTYHAGPRSILTQLCLALSGLALQLPSWEDPMQDMIDSFGRNPATVPAFLQFLTVLPEELCTNTKIPVTDDEYKERARKLMTANARKVLDLLSMYLTAAGVTIAIQTQVFSCLSSWLAAGEISALSLAETPLLRFAFEALASDDLFEPAVSVICDVIHETQEIEDNMPVIEQLVPRIIALRRKLTEFKEDSERIRGYARIFAEAGETYRALLLHHPETFFPIVEAIGECSAYPDLDIVPITFHFWMRLAQAIGKKPSVPAPFLDAYKALLRVIILHLHFPEDLNPLTGQEAEDFRSFRHVMGDTLKDCCYVLGADWCLLATYEMITAALARPNVSWQEIEAPLFSMRSMGAEVDPTDDKAVPKIMDLIPLLPTHPRVRYAALLIISRYTEWINRHPDYIPYQLQYISAGFEDNDSEVNAAAGQALKYLCQDCRRHLVDFLPQLHTFLGTMGSKLAQDDKIQVYEAVAYVISAMPMEQAAQSLRTFSLDILAQVHTIAIKPTPATKEELKAVANGLENLEVMLGVIDTFGDELPEACRNSAQEAWAFFDPFIAKCGSEYEICERTTRVLRLGLNFFGTTVRPVLPSVLARMSATFERTGFSSYLWIFGKIIGRFGNEEDPTLRMAFKEAFERTSEKLVLILQEKSPAVVPDLMEDYLQMLLQMFDYTPDILFTSPAFPIALRVAIGALTVVHSDIIFAALEFLRNVLTHECLLPTAVGTVQPPKFPVYAAAIRPAVQREGPQLTGYLLAGVVGDFPEESVPIVVTIFRSLTALSPTELISWLPAVVQQISSSSAPEQSKTQFIADISSAIQSAEYDKVKRAILALHRASCKARDRRRAVALGGD
ncbi:ARM repeat-containing protein [Laetiporus sulphureus 93-53]|uniref:ARM repeat-containing protein n=1 Tax=Laetiporus sulphureus 93-53 TaxID=1314785 RepID=A0A165DY72_9APHY|nr:ARM repeat-containing protein [Laetiporus sulphureus 93-53]KZT05860.1 ARM repeat-containing protein [Laetiporus sulphureus 93-53]